MKAAGSKRERDWAELPQEILELIASRVCLADHRVFGLVCSPWRRASTSKLAKPRCCRFPWLMLPKCKSMETRVFYCHEHERILQHPLPPEVLKSWCSGASHGWFIMARKTKNGGGDFMFNPLSGARVSLPTHHPILDDRDNEMPHLHPYYINKAILSSDDGIADQGSNCLVAAIYESNSRSHIGICRPGDQDWTWTEALVAYGIIEGENHGGHSDDDDNNGDEFVGGEGDDANNDVEDGDQSDDDGNISEDDEDESTDDEDEPTDSEDEEGGGEEEGAVFMVGEEEPVNDNEERVGIIDGLCVNGLCDIMFHKGNIYAITRDAKLYVCDIIGDGISWRRVQTQPFKLKLKRNSAYFVHMVESRGELLMVVRLFTETHPVVLRTNRFIIFRMVLDQESRCDQHPKWVRVESLGDQALFLGRNHSQSVSVSDSLNFQENCIYYADQDYPVCYGPSNKDLFRYGDWGALKLDGSRVENFGQNEPSFLPSNYHRHRYTPLWIRPSP
ncbi:hypothetical protein RJ639_004753 [Escallonia herrerae]|uniref:DUF295 domain-containing protein n=1 Tax=Escallonia herrerae TaxID=1293975 RepID=A0AA88VZH0_9ASTE|nr:hypothetical protein RJ639_004753 [Escallonia herrerae]